MIECDVHIHAIFLSMHVPFVEQSNPVLPKQPVPCKLFQRGPNVEMTNMTTRLGREKISAYLILTHPVTAVETAKIRNRQKRQYKGPSSCLHNHEGGKPSECLEEERRSKRQDVDHDDLPRLDTRQYENLP